MIRSITKNRKIRLLLIVLFWLFIWEGLYLIIGRDIYFPSPAATIETLGLLFTKSESYVVILNSIYRTVLALLFSAAIGIPLGALCGVSKNFFDLFNPLIIVLRSTPVISIIIIAIIWFPSTQVPVFAGFLMCFPVIFTSTAAGIGSTDVKLLEMCRIYRIPGRRVISSVYLPSALPFINAGIITSIGMGWKAVAAAEVLAMPKNSIGANLFFAKIALDPCALFAWTFVIIILSYIFEGLYGKVSGYDKAKKRKHNV